MSSSNLHPTLILASKSPRRKYLLRQAGLEFHVIPGDFDESSVPQSNPEAYVKTLALSKAEQIAAQYPESWVIGADTIVVIGDRILGKPSSKEEAGTMLSRLSGNIHQVFTGFAVCCKSRGKAFSEMVQTDVYFKKLTVPEIEWYIRTEEPFDKAGAYGVQGIGAFLVKAINGSYTNVVGLPMCELMELLIREGVVGLNPGNGLIITGT